MQLQHSPSETTKIAEASSGDLARLHALEQARQADADLREERRARLRQQIAAFPRWYQWGIGAVMGMGFIPLNRLERAVRADPGLFPSGFGSPSVAVTVLGMMLFCCVVGLGTLVAFEWLKRRESELAGLTEESGASDAGVRD